MSTRQKLLLLAMVLGLLSNFTISTVSAADSIYYPIGGDGTPYVIPKDWKLVSVVLDSNKLEKFYTLWFQDKDGKVFVIIPKLLGLVF